MVARRRHGDLSEGIMAASGDRGDVRKLIDEHLPPEIQRELLRAQFRIYATADLLAREFDEPQRRKVYGHYRLVLWDNALKVIGHKYAERFVVEDIPTANGSYHYVALRAGLLLLTCAAVMNATTLPRKSHYRDTLARGRQHELFPELEAENPGRFWPVILTHTYERKLVTNAETGVVSIKRLRDRPAFAQLVVPTRDAEGIMVNVALFEEHPELIRELRGVVAPERLGKNDVARRPHRKRADDQSETGESR